MLRGALRGVLRDVVAKGCAKGFERGVLRGLPRGVYRGVIWGALQGVYEGQCFLHAIPATSAVYPRFVFACKLPKGPNRALLRTVLGFF